MALRLLELTVPGEEVEKILELLQGTTVIQTWTLPADGEERLVRILLDAEHVEAVSDALLGHFGPREGLRLLELPVEATVPAVEPPAKSEPEAQDETAPETTEPQRISREELYEDVAEASRLTPVYMTMVALSTVVAAVGLIRGDVAIIIGAMVIAPLLGPNVALSLACTLGDPTLAKQSLRAIFTGVTIAAALSLLLGAVLNVNPEVAAIGTRTRANIGDVILALAAGGVVVGVMVAVALLPPLVVAGLLAGSGHWMPAVGALTLLLTNVTCINLAAVATFLLQKVRPRTWWEEDRAGRASRLAVATWILMLAILLALMLLGHVGGGLRPAIG
ncbi:MAG: TIGR00341 family protein [Gammaproteobacteria bacterium]